MHIDQYSIITRNKINLETARHGFIYLPGGVGVDVA